MFVLVNKFILAKRFDGIVLWPFVLVRRKELKANKIFMNHESIHIKQQLELLVIPFFIWYFFEYFFRLIQTQSTLEAYYKISFEREAYANEKDFNYLVKRKFWAFLKYL